MDPWQELTGEIDELVELFELARSENDESLSEEIRSGLARAQKKYDKQRVIELLSDEHDSASCYLTIHSGAGGDRGLRLGEHAPAHVQPLG